MTTMRLRFFVSLVFAIATAGMSAADNALSPQEKAEGWRLLFDGESFAGWHGYRKTGMPEAGWEVKDGLLKTVPKVRGSDIVTEATFTDFELSWEWRVAKNGNNGLKYLVLEERPNAPGHEYQMLDDEGHPDGKIGPHRQTAAFYDVLPPAADKPSRPIGEWNESRVVLKGNAVEHWLNGKKVLSYTLGSPEILAAVKKSKFASDATFGTKNTGHIMLTYHADECWFRNIKIRPLK